MPVDYKDEISSTIRRVCREWSVAVNRYPQIWSTIPPIVTKDLESEMHALAIRSYAKRYLECSRSLPLDFSLSIVDERGVLSRSGWGAGWAAIFEVFLEHSGRWRNADIYTSLDILPAIQQVKGRLHALERLRIRVSPYRSPYQEMRSKPDIGTIRLECFSEVPRLKYLDLGLTSNCTRIDISLPLDRLHSITFAPSTPNNLYENLCASPHNLRQLIVKWDHLTQSYEPLPSVTFPQLEHLVYSGQSNTIFIDLLTLPALKNLELRGNGGEISIQGLNAKIVPLLIRSQCTLRHLSLTRTMTPAPEELQEIFTLTPRLTHLSIWNVPSSELELLIYDSGSSNSVLLPELQYLVFGISAVWMPMLSHVFPFPEMAQVIHSRCPTSSAIRTANACGSELVKPLRQVAFWWGNSALIFSMMASLTKLLQLGEGEPECGEDSVTERGEDEEDGPAAPSDQHLQELAKKAKWISALDLNALFIKDDERPSADGKSVVEKRAEVELLFQRLEKVDFSKYRSTIFLVS